MKRWNVKIIYRHDGGAKSVDHYIEELDEVAEIVEAGPHWDTIITIAITRYGGDPTLTVERAATM